jgi:hypothetical protein
MRRVVGLLIAASGVVTACAHKHPVIQSLATPGFLNDAPKTPELLMLGVFHFDDPGLDAYKARFKVNVMLPERQKEIEEIVERLAQSRPTKIAVEVTADRQRWLDSLYNEYLEGRYRPGPNEVYQLGFRVARRLGHQRVYAVDAPSRSVLTEQNVSASVAKLHIQMDTIGRAIEGEPWNMRYRRLYEYDDSLKTVVPLVTYLAYINSPERLRIGHGAYTVGGFRLLGPNADYLGPDDATEWYNRNLRIYSNLQWLAKMPEDRILLIIGAGHLPILHFLANSAPDLKLIDIAPVLR